MDALDALRLFEAIEIPNADARAREEIRLDRQRGALIQDVLTSGYSVQDVTDLYYELADSMAEYEHVALPLDDTDVRRIVRRAGRRT